MQLNPITWAKRLDRAIWQLPTESLPPAKRRWVRFARVLYVLGRDLASGQLTLRSMSLVYTTILSLVPLLALSFSVLKAFGVYNQLEPVLANFLAPLVERGEELTRRIMGFIDNINVGVLGAVGLALLIYTVVSLIQKIEEAFNFIWHVSHERKLSERFSRYLSVLLVGPLLLFSAMGITATVMNTEWMRRILAVDPLEQVVVLLGNLMPYLLVIGAFTFIYVFIPNTRVRPGAAFIGGIAGGVLWQSAGWAFAVFVASSTQYAAIYSGFAILVLFMIWLYLSWLILLFGASVAFYAQNPQYLVPLGGEPQLSNRMRERLALAIMCVVAGAYREARPPLTLHDLTRRLGVPMHGVATVLEALRQGKLLAESAEEPPGFLPARDLGVVSVHELLGVVRAAGEDRYVNPGALPLPAAVQEVLDRVEAESARTLGQVSISSLAASQSP